jgi:hypothetical protein
MRTFLLKRHRDISGVSGEGIVAEGVIFSNGKVCMSWLGRIKSEEFFDTLGELIEIHGHGGATEVLLENVRDLPCNTSKPTPGIH